MHLLFSAFFLFLISLCFYFHWTRRRLFRLSWNVPGPLNLPLVGASYMGFKGNSTDVGKQLFQVIDSYPKLFKFWGGPHLVYITRKAEYAKIILNSSGATEKFCIMDYLSTLLGNGLITQKADIWRRHRKIIAPSFNRNILNTYPKVISEQCLVLLDKLEKCVGKEEVDPRKYITNCAFDIVGDTFCGVPINAQKNDETYGEAIEKGFEILFLRMTRLPYHLNLVFKRSKEYKILMEAIQKIKSIAERVLENSRNKTDTPPFIRLMQTNQLTEKETLDQIYTFLIGGTDTIAESMCVVLTNLAIHEDVQQKVYDEVIEVVGSNPTIDLATLNKLDYTKRVIKESLRITPTVPLIGRFLDEDIVLEGTTVPKGANVFLSILHIHRSEDYWKEPLKFDPDRFLPENSTDRHPHAWIPFSAGPRNCIGFQQGELTMKIMTAMIIRKFKVTTSFKSIDDIEFDVHVIAKPIGGFKLKFELR